MPAWKRLHKADLPRCLRLAPLLVVASGWYEWSAPKRPWHVQLGDGGVMGMGGLLLRRGSEDRFVIMTSAANGELTSIHHRQPLVLPPDSWHRWLSGGAQDAAELCVAAPASWFNWYRVGPAVGRVAEDHPELVTPLDDAALAAENQPAAGAQGRRGAGRPVRLGSDVGDGDLAHLDGIEMPEHERAGPAPGTPCSPNISISSAVGLASSDFRMRIAS